MSVLGLSAGERALVVAPHPDDETLGCGGTIARLVADGVDVHVLAVTVRAAPMWGGVSDPVVRQNEFIQACAALGVTTQAMAWIDETGDLDIAARPRALVELIEQHPTASLAILKPDALLIPAAGGFHQDHQVVHRAAFAAARVHARESKHTPSLVLGFRGVEDHWCAQEEPWRVHVNTSAHWYAKEHALRCYTSQLRGGGHPRAIENIRTTDAAAGGALGWHYAEKFVPYRLAY
ncbi:PIG-L deacetylase family protein [Saccharopolyspora phatthalungensis]|uniref:LmbE family N-acetylglucosaminyl deacetylase n=1 Tax=Saccharopolyspora phatthalungensis TaxID=664693 RepID=A0A840QJM1_9PSEU|nr:PIG-L family deacetylase [Saccharopolyspora phatthalungensis]MBB5159289.1 LmbE family N-acetylglucosaminyl deacetylase [Saccharopolyspora phatthalungensis]